MIVVCAIVDVMICVSAAMGDVTVEIMVKDPTLVVKVEIEPD